MILLSSPTKIAQTHSTNELAEMITLLLTYSLLFRLIKTAWCAMRTGIDGPVWSRRRWHLASVLTCQLSFVLGKVLCIQATIWMLIICLSETFYPHRGWCVLSTDHD